MLFPLCAAILGLALPKTVSLTFNVYYGPASHVYTNKISGILGLQLTVSGLPTNSATWFVVTAQNRQGLESDYSNEISSTNLAAVTLYWDYGKPVTNVITIASGTNSLSLTNPTGSCLFRVAANRLEMALGGANWAVLDFWPGSTNRIAISQTVLP